MKDIHSIDIIFEDQKNADYLCQHGSMVVKDSLCLSMTLDGINMGSRAARIWRAIKKMENLGNDIIEKFLGTITSQVGNLLDNLNWKKGVGAILPKDVNAVEFWEVFRAKFPNATPISLATYELDGFKIGNIRFSLKYGGNTNPDGYTIEIKKGSKIFKIRLGTIGT